MIFLSALQLFVLQPSKVEPEVSNEHLIIIIIHLDHHFVRFVTIKRPSYDSDSSSFVLSLKRL